MSSGGPGVVLSFESESVTVPVSVAAKCSVLVADMVDGEEVDSDIPIALPAGNRSVLDLLKEYMTLRHANPPKPIDRPLERPITEVVDDVDKLFLSRITSHDDALQLLSVAMFLNYPGLKDLMSAQIADWMKDMDLEEIRTMWGVTNDFTPEEIEALKKEHNIVDR